jgi:hypothetical protein
MGQGAVPSGVFRPNRWGMIRWWIQEITRLMPIVPESEEFPVAKFLFEIKSHVHLTVRPTEFSGRRKVLHRNINSLDSMRTIAWE